MRLFVSYGGQRKMYRDHPIFKKFDDIGYSAKEGTSRVDMTNRLKKAYDEGKITLEDMEKLCIVCEENNNKGNREANERRRKDLKNLKIYVLYKKKEQLDLNHENKSSDFNIFDYEIPEDLQNIIDAYEDIDADYETCIEAFQSIIDTYDELDIEDERCIEMQLDYTLAVTQITVDKLRNNENFFNDFDKELIISYVNTICDIMHIHNLLGLEYTCYDEEKSSMVRLGKLSIILFVKVFDAEVAFSYIENVIQYVKNYLEK